MFYSQKKHCHEETMMGKKKYNVLTIILLNHFTK